MRSYQAKSTVKPAQVLADIDAGKVQSAYVLFGADSAAADEVVAALKPQLLAPGFDAFDFESGHGDDIDVTMTLQHMNQPPMGSKRRLMVIRDIGRMDKDPATKLCEGIAKAPEFTTVVIIAAYESKLKTLFNTTGLAKYIVNLYEPYPDDMIHLLRRWAKERKMELTPEAASLLRDIAGSDTALLKSELDKLATTVGKDGRATVEVVRAMASNSREYSLKEYVDRALGRDAKRALGVLRQLAEWGEEPIRIIAWLVTGLLRATEGAAESQGRWEARELNLALHQLYDINKQIVTGYPEPFLLLEAYTVCLACSGREKSCRLLESPRPPQFCLRRSRSGAARRKAV